MLENYKIKNEELINKKLDKYLDNKSQCEIWSFGNNILYKMCKDNPKHNEPDKIAGKLWIIGRSYAAAIERRKANREVESEDFFREIVIKGILQNGNELDDKIKRIQKHSCINEDNIDDILKTHKYLTDIFENFTKLEKRSLASKYLHFHCPRAFFIYDSRANKSISEIVKKLPKKTTNKEYDKEYQDFCCRALVLKKYIETKTGYNKNFTPRDIDNLLVFTKLNN